MTALAVRLARLERAQRLQQVVFAPGANHAEVEVEVMRLSEEAGPGVRIVGVVTGVPRTSAP